METLKVKVRKEKRSYLQVRMKCQIASTVPSWQVSYVDNPGIREKREWRGEERRGEERRGEREGSQSNRVHGRSCCHVLEERSQSCRNQTID